MLLFRRHLRDGHGGLVVVKRLANPRDYERRERLYEEVRLAFRLNHPAIARVHHFRVVRGSPHAILEHVDGPSLEALVTAATLRQRPLPAPFALHVAREVADALHYAHTLRDEENAGRPLGIIHRDVSPRNIRVDMKTGTIKLTDFGAAFSKRIGREPSPEGLRKGDLFYSSPEYLFGATMDARSDVFSLGVVLLEALTNKHLFSDLDEREEEGPALDVRAEDESPLPLRAMMFLAQRYTPEDVERATETLPEGQRAIIRRALRREPAERYATAEEMARELRAQLVALVPEYGREEAAADTARVITEASGYRDVGEPREGGLHPNGFDMPERPERAARAVPPGPSRPSGRSRQRPGGREAVGA